jgi:hypothetical protein
MGLQKVSNERDFRHEADYDLGDINKRWGKSPIDHESYTSIWIENTSCPKAPPAEALGRTAFQCSTMGSSWPIYLDQILCH